MKVNPVFEYTPLEKSIKDTQEEYYRVLNESDQSGLSTQFVEYSLEKIKLSLEELLEIRPENMGDEERTTYFLNEVGDAYFTRSDYLKIFPNISPATASRDLQKAVEKEKKG